jgi:hypothetical protein
MRAYIPASEDTTLYQRFPNSNAGLDEILEIGKLKDCLDTVVMYASASTRALLNFDISSIQSYPTTSKFYLTLYLANAKEVKRYQNLEIYPVSSSWVEGSGYFYQTQRNAEDGATWIESSENTSWNVSGSDYLLTPSASISLSQVPISDIRVDITDILLPFVSGTNTFDWNGLIVKFPDADELLSTNRGNIKVFSSNTHTIFSPKIEVLWNNQTFTTGSLKPIPGSNVSIVSKNLKEAYTSGEIDKIYLVVRDQYPNKRFDEVQRYKNTYYLPSSSYYRLTDVVSGTKIHDFDAYSPVQCDASGSYIILDTSGLYADRYYSLELKVVKDNLVFFPEFNYTFKVDTNG